MMPKSLPYHDFLITHLKDPNYAALYLENHFELEEGEDIDLELLNLALNHVAEALGETKMTPEEAKLHQEKLKELLSKPGIEAIYSLGEWLKAIGLKLTVTVAEEEQETVTNEAEVTVS